VTAVPFGILPVLEFKAVVSQVKTIDKGDCISYGNTFTAETKMKVATLTVGYADGYSRSLSVGGEVLIHGVRCRVLGRVCMDQIVVDVSGVSALKAGDVATLIGSDGDEVITVDDIALICDTISYEIVCGISARVPRIYV
jgi:alanine racemase